MAYSVTPTFCSFMTAAVDITQSQAITNVKSRFYNVVVFTKDKRLRGQQLPPDSDITTVFT